MEDLLKDLNSKQKEAVLATEGPVLVLAGAGSGKTKTLTHRIAYLIREKDVSPYNILAVTFTNKAAGEMADRVEKLLRSNQSDTVLRLPWLGTFHSICVRILRREAEFIGYGRNFTIYDDNDQKAIIKKILKDLNIDPKHFSPQTVQYFISGAKNELMSAAEYKKYGSSPMETVASKVYEIYAKYLKEQNAMDFDDLLMQCVHLFEQNPEILKKYQETFKYILIDEYQDTNQAQYIWVKMLAEKHKNIMVVGDDYQAIYGWRGANFKNILNFEKNYPDAKIVKLEQNYRSTQTILAAADQVIKYNRNRTDKTLWTENEKGMPITIYKALNEKDEAEFVCLEISSLAKQTGNNSYDPEAKGQSERSVLRSYIYDNIPKRQYNDIAVLYRTNAQSRVLEESLLRFNIPYKIVGGVRFYERKEIKDIIAYLRLVANPFDEAAFYRIVNVPARGIGEKTAEQIRQISKSEILNPKEISNPKISKKIIDFLSLMEEIRLAAADMDLDTLVEHIAVKTGYKIFLLDGTPEGEGRWENVLELVSVAQEFQEKNSEEPELSAAIDQLPAFLERIALVQDTDSLDKNSNAVTLMTMHSAKGLEFNNVFIVGAEEGLFPHSRALQDESEMEEERRLAYVGITRAKKRLYLIYACERNIYGRFQSNPKSRFIEHISEDLLDEI